MPAARALSPTRYLFAAVLTAFLLVPGSVLASECCICTNPQVTGKFCLKDVNSCNDLVNSSVAEIKASSCSRDVSANPCKKQPAGLCLNEPVTQTDFKLSALPGYKAPAGGSSSSASGPKALDMKLNVAIPGLTLLAPYKDSSVVIIPMFAQYIQAFHKILIGIGLVAAAIMFVYAGWLYLVTGVGLKGTRQPKQIMIDAAIGLIIILGSVVIISNLNPNTASLSALQLADLRQELFDFSTGYNPEEAGGESDFSCDECPNMKNPSFKGAATRMKEACKGGGSKESLKQVLLAWSKEAIPDGSGYIRGGSGYGKSMKLASPFTGFLFCSLGKYAWISEESKKACGLPDDFKFDPSRTGGHCTNGETININHKDFASNTLIKEAAQKRKSGPCYEALKQNYGTHFACPMKCNDLFGADCSGFVGLALQCAGINRSASDVYLIRNQAIAEANFAGAAAPSFPPKICRNKKGQHLSASDPKCEGAGSDDCRCETYSKGFAIIGLSPDQVLSHKSSIPFGTTMEKDCKGGAIAHMFLYTGGAGLPFEVIQSGGGGGKGATFLNWKGISEFSVGIGVNTVPSLDSYLSGCNAKYIYGVTGFSST